MLSFEHQAGDLNADGQVDLMDAVKALQVVAGFRPAGGPLMADAADVDAEGRIGLAEALYILQALADVR